MGMIQVISKRIRILAWIRLLLYSTLANSLTDFEEGFGNEARKHVGPCARIEDDGFRAECSLLAALDTQTRVASLLLEKSNISGGGIDNPPPDKCKYREQGGPRLHRYASKTPLYLKQVLDSYATMHRYCMGLEYYSLASMYAHKRKPQCRYIVWSCTFGLGNKLMSLLSTLLYAILSQRVLLIEEPGWEHLFCEPFPGSRLQVPDGLSLKKDDSTSFVEFQKHKCAASRETQHCGSNVVEIVISDVSKPSDHSFLVCPRGMATVRDIPFLNLRNSNQYFAAGFFLNPALRPLLERIFPAHNVFHMLAQNFLSPNNAVWAQIKTFHQQYLLRASLNIGVQLRESKGEYRQYFDDVVPHCIKTKAALCPIELEEQLERELADGPSSDDPNNYSLPLTSVYVSSLAGGHFPSLQQSVAKLELEMRQRFLVVAQEGDCDNWESKML